MKIYVNLTLDGQCERQDKTHHRHQSMDIGGHVLFFDSTGWTGRKRVCVWDVWTK